MYSNLTKGGRVQEVDDFPILKTMVRKEVVDGDHTYGKYSNVNVQ